MTEIFNQFELTGTDIQTKEWRVIEITKQNNNLKLKYQFDELSDTIINDRLTYLNFHKMYRVTSGNWEGESGYWLTLKRIEREIECISVSELIEKKHCEGVLVIGKTIIFKKDIFSSSIEVKVSSKNIGFIDFRCKSIKYTDHYNIGLCSTAEDKFILATHLFDRHSSTFIGK